MIYLDNAATTQKPRHGMAVEAFQDGQRPISGTLILTPGVLTLTTNSMERAERGKNALEALLHGRIGPALSKLQTPEQVLAEGQDQTERECITVQESRDQEASPTNRWGG